MFSSIFVLATLVSVAFAACPKPPNAVQGGYVCRTGSTASETGNQQWAQFCCMSGAKPTGTGCKITCVNNANWNKPKCSCGAAGATNNQPMGAPTNMKPNTANVPKPNTNLPISGTMNRPINKPPTNQQTNPRPQQPQPMNPQQPQQPQQAKPSQQQPAAPAPASSQGGLSTPHRGSQCGAVSGPPTRCLGDKAAEVYAIPISEVVDRHNYWRSNVNPPAKNLGKLQWDDELNILAERWAAQCPSGHDGYPDRALDNRNTNGVSWKYVGQNICFASNNRTWTQCIDSWAGEQKDFVFGQGSNGAGQTGHYTQVVAERSTHVGCGWSYCPNLAMKFIQVCNYAPAGNFNGGEKTPYST